jgi:hypothetical protein
MERIRFDGRALILLGAVLAISTVSGRQLFLDGAYQIVSSTTDPFWYPENQPTPRRFISQMWSNGLLRILGYVWPGYIEIAELVYGAMSFGLILIGAAALVRARMELTSKYVLVALYFGGYMVLANFIVSEIALTLAMTTVVVAFTISPAEDAQGWKRLAAALLLSASYEVVAVSNLILAYGCWRAAHAETARVWPQKALVPVLIGGAIFQFVSYLINPLPGNGGTDRDLTMYLLAGLLACAIVATLLAFKLLQRWPIVCSAIIWAALILPALLFFVPQAVHFRTDLFQFAYPGRLATMCVVLMMSAMPLLLDRKIWSWPGMALDWLGEGAAKDGGMAVFAAFCGLSLLSSLDAARFFSRLDAELAKHPGRFPIAHCGFCQNPEAQNTANLGYGWIWAPYSRAISLNHRERPFTIVISEEASGPGRTRSTEAPVPSGHTMPLLR